jgi:hypothetical protein
MAMNPFNTRAIAEHRDACEEAGANRDVEAFERDKRRDELRDAVNAAAKNLLVVYQHAEAHGLDPDQAVEDALAALDQLRARPATPDHDKEADHA